MPKIPDHPCLPFLKRKNQSVPNALFLNTQLSDEAVRLLAILNATDTCESASNPSIMDLSCLLKWDETKIKNVMKECESAGYMKLSRGDFSFDVEPSFAKGSRS